MECALAFFDGNVKPFTEHIPTAVVRQFEIINAGHYAGKVVIWRIRWLAGAADDRENGGQTLEAYIKLIEYPGKDDGENLTSNWKFWTACNKLEEVPALLWAQLTHDFEQVSHTLAIHIEAMICFDGIHES